MKAKTIIATATLATALFAVQAQADEIAPQADTSAEPVETQAQDATVTIPSENATVETQDITQAPETDSETQNEVSGKSTPETQENVAESNSGASTGIVDLIEVKAKENTVGTYDAVEGEIKFHVEDGTAKAGDYTEIKMPEELKLVRIPSQPVELKTDADVAFAQAEFDSEANTIRIVYNSNVEGLLNVSGGFNFYIALNLDAVKEVKEIELAFTVNDKKTITQTIDFVGIGKKNSPTFEKTSWQNTSKANVINTAISIGKDGNTYSDMTIEDDIAAESEDNATYDYDSFRVRIGSWVWSDIYGYQFDSTQDITEKVEWLAKNHGDFKLKLPAEANGQQVYITYNLIYSHPVEAGETVNNKAILTAKDQQISEWQSFASIYDISGWINGDKPIVPDIPVVPTPDEPEKPKEPEAPKPEEPKEGENDKEPIVAKTNPVFERNEVTTAKSAYKAQLPKAGEAESATFTLAGLALISVLTLVKFGGKHENI